MTRTRIFWLAATAFAAVALSVHAQDVQTPAPSAPPGPSSSPPGEARLDQNGDGSITKAEARADAELARRFSELDTDNSGKLDQGEFARFEVDAP